MYRHSRDVPTRPACFTSRHTIRVLRIHSILSADGIPHEAQLPRAPSEQAGEHFHEPSWWVSGVTRGLALVPKLAHRDDLIV
jgi:hypothetical protein